MTGWQDRLRISSRAHIGRYERMTTNYEREREREREEYEREMSSLCLSFISGWREGDVYHFKWKLAKAQGGKTIFRGAECPSSNSLKSRNSYCSVGISWASSWHPASLCPWAGIVDGMWCVGAGVWCTVEKNYWPLMGKNHYMGQKTSCLSSPSHTQRETCQSSLLVTTCSQLKQQVHIDSTAHSKFHCWVCTANAFSQYINWCMSGYDYMCLERYSWYFSWYSQRDLYRVIFLLQCLTSSKL